MDIKYDVPQSSVLVPILYSIYTADLLSSSNVMIATFADDTSILAADNDTTVALNKVQLKLLSMADYVENYSQSSEVLSCHIYNDKKYMPSSQSGQWCYFP